MRLAGGRPASVLLAPALVAALVVLGGCGGEEGVAPGATARAYFGVNLCAGAKRALAAAGGRAEEVRVRAVCLAPTEGAALGSHRLKLAAIGRNARRATQDSTAVAFVEAPGRANRFSRPIVEEAEIAYLETGSGAAAMRAVLAAIEAAGSDGSLRDGVRKNLESE